jgi:hypothetical protein
MVVKRRLSVEDGYTYASRSQSAAAVRIKFCDSRVWFRVCEGDVAMGSGRPLGTAA